MDEQALRPSADRHRAVSESVCRCVMMILSNKVKKMHWARLPGTQGFARSAAK